MIDLSIFIVNYNGAKFISQCLDSVFASDVQFTYEVIVVDNNSTDSSLSLLKKYGAQIQLINNSENQGFSYANNQAAESAKGKTYFLLNNDTILEKDTLQILFEFLKENPKVGAITPKLCFEDGRLQAPGSIFGKWRFNSLVPVQVPFIAGAAVMMSASVYKAIGGLDANLFFYNDDIDMCKMLTKLGYPIYYVPTAKLIHFGGLSTKFRKIGSLIEGYRGGLYVCYKHYHKIVFFIYQFLVLLDCLVRLSIHLILSLLSHESRAFVKAYLRVMCIVFKREIFYTKLKE